MATPRFSVVIPTAGNAELVRQAVQSVLAQSFKNWELIVIDLSKTKEAKEATLNSQDARIRYIEAPEGGPFTTWNEGAKVGSGEYILWLDDDNILFPFALELFDRAIQKSKADIVSANHLYYYDDDHPRHFLRNTIGIIPFTDTTKNIVPGEVIRSLFSLERRGSNAPLPRFHFSATAISRRVVDAAIKRLGFVLFVDGLGIHSLQPILFSFAKSVFYVDHLIVLIGRLGISMGQSWATKAKERIKKRPWAPVISPFTAYTRINGILDNFLRAQAALPETLGKVPLRLDRFAEYHGRELLYLDTDPRTAWRDWKNYFSVLKTLPEPEAKAFHRRARRWAFKAPFVYISRRLKIHHVRRALAKAPTSEHEFNIPIRPSESWLDAAPRIVRERLDKDIYSLPL